VIDGPLSLEDYARLRQQLARSVRRVCPAWLAASADDIVQGALVKVLNLQQRSEGERRLETSYLVRMAYSAVVDEIRRRRRSREVPMAVTAEESVADRLPDPERIARGHEIGVAIADCLAGLVLPRRLAVTLHLQGHTVPEAGSLLGWSAKRAENLVYRGLADLRACLAGKGLRP
jgi:RNA polymerase sigma-70 factor (ECF subfamily)